MEKRSVNTYQIVMNDNSIRVIQAHRMYPESRSMLDWDNSKPIRYNFFKDPHGVIASFIEDDIKEITMIEEGTIISNE